eukprot:213850-Amorphochlora_amoeboformis.AAC.1
MYGRRNEKGAIYAQQTRNTKRRWKQRHRRGRLGLRQYAKDTCTLVIEGCILYPAGGVVS